MKPITRTAAVFLTLCLFFCFSAAAFAEDDSVPSAEETLPVSEAVPQSPGTPIVHSGNPIVTVGTLKFSYWSYLSGASKTASLQAIDLKTMDGAVAYCIEPELSGDGTNYTPAQQEAAWAKLPADLRYAIALVLAYGYPNQDYAASSDDIYWYGKVAIRNTENYIATQLIIWELLAGVRSSTKPFALTGSTSFRNSFDIGWATIRSTYDAISAKMATHNTIPAYASGIEGSYVYTLEYDSAADAHVYQLPTQRQSDWRECRMTLPDGIRYLKAPDGMTVIGFSATVEAAAALPPDGYVVRGQSPYLSVAPDTAVLCWMCGGSQTIATMPVGPDPARAFFTLKANVTADLELIKTSPDGKIGGISFTLYDSGGTKIASGITNENGRMTVKGLQIGQTYTVTETVPEGYVCTENNKKSPFRRVRTPSSLRINPCRA